MRLPGLDCTKGVLLGSLLNLAWNEISNVYEAQMDGIERGSEPERKWKCQ
jgi:hypothetical protein